MSKSIERATRPSQAFLEKVGIASLPNDIDILFDDPAQVTDGARHAYPAFLIRQFDGAAVCEDRIPVGRDEAEAYKNVRQRLLALGAKAA